MGWQDAPVADTWMTAPEVAPQKSSNVDFAAANLYRGLSSAAGGLVDVPVNLAKAGYGMGRQLVGRAMGESPSEAASHVPEISYPVSEQLFKGPFTPEAQRKMEQDMQPTSNVGRYAARALQFAGGAPVGGLSNLPRNAISAALAGVTSQGAQDVFPNSNVAPVVGALVPAGVSAGVSAGSSLLASRPNPALLANAQKANELGLKVPPGEVQPTAVNTVLGSVGGKAATAAQASRSNQPVLNKIITDEIDNSAKKIGASLPTPDLNGLKDVRQKAGEVYDQASNLGTFTIDNTFRREFGAATKQSSAIANEVPSLLDKTLQPLIADFSGKKTISSKAVVESIKELRSQAQDNFAGGNKGTARSQLSVANALEGLMERNIAPIQGAEFLQKFRDARELYAKTDDVLKAFNPTTGNFDSGVFARALKKGRPLTGGLRDVGEFATQFPSAAKLPEKLGAPTSKVDALIAAHLGTVGGYIAKGVGGLALGGLPFVAPPAARGTLLSNFYQNRLVNPSVVPNGSAIISPGLQLPQLESLYGR